MPDWAVLCPSVVHAIVLPLDRRMSLAMLARCSCCTVPVQLFQVRWLVDVSDSCSGPRCPGHHPRVVSRSDQPRAPDHCRLREGIVHDRYPGYWSARFDLIPQGLPDGWLAEDAGCVPAGQSMPDPGCRF